MAGTGFPATDDAVDSAGLTEDLESNSYNIIMADNNLVRFGDATISAALYQDGADLVLNLRENGSGNLMIALAGSFPSPDADKVHIWKGSAGAVANDRTDVGLLLEDTGNTFLALLAPDDSLTGFYFGGVTDATRGQIFYGGPSHSVADTFRFFTAGNNERLRISAGALAFQEATVISATVGDLTWSPADNVVVTTPLDVESYMSIGNGQALSANNTLIVDRDFTATSAARMVQIRGVITQGTSNDVYFQYIWPQGTTISNTFTAPVVASLRIDEPAITLNGSGAITNAVTLYVSGAPTEGTNNYAVWIVGLTRVDGDIGDTTNRVTKLWTIDQDTTNAENVSSWSAVKVPSSIHAYTERALDVLRGVDVITFKHLNQFDPSGRVKLGVRAESFSEALVTPFKDYGEGFGEGPGVDMMGLAALNTKGIQELEQEVLQLRQEVEALRG